MILQRENDLKILVVHVGGFFFLKGLLIVSNWSFVVFDVSLSHFSVCFFFLSSLDNSETPGRKYSSWPVFPPEFQVFYLTESLFNLNYTRITLYVDCNGIDFLFQTLRRIHCAHASKTQQNCNNNLHIKLLRRKSKYYTWRQESSKVAKQSKKVFKTFQGCIQMKRFLLKTSG